MVKATVGADGPLQLLWASDLYPTLFALVAELFDAAAAFGLATARFSKANIDAGFFKAGAHGVHIDRAELFEHFDIAAGCGFT